MGRKKFLFIKVYIFSFEFHMFSNYSQKILKTCVLLYVTRFHEYLYFYIDLIYIQQYSLLLSRT